MSSVHDMRTLNSEKQNAMSSTNITELRTTKTKRQQLAEAEAFCPVTFPFPDRK